MGAQDRGSWFELPFWRLVKFLLFCIFVIGALVWIPLTLIGVYTNWYQLLLLRMGVFLLDIWYLSLPISGMLVVIGYFQIRSYRKKHVGVKQQRINSSQSARS